MAVRRTKGVPRRSWLNSRGLPLFEFQVVYELVSTVGVALFQADSDVFLFKLEQQVLHGKLDILGLLQQRVANSKEWLLIVPLRPRQQIDEGLGLYSAVGEHPLDQVCVQVLVDSHLLASFCPNLGLLLARPLCSGASRSPIASRHRWLLEGPLPCLAGRLAFVLLDGHESYKRWIFQLLGTKILSDLPQVAIHLLWFIICWVFASSDFLIYSVEILQRYWALEGVWLAPYSIFFHRFEVYLALIVKKILVVQVCHFLLVQKLLNFCPFHAVLIKLAHDLAGILSHVLV